MEDAKKNDFLPLEDLVDSGRAIRKIEKDVAAIKDSLDAQVEDLEGKYLPAIQELEDRKTFLMEKAKLIMVEADEKKIDLKGIGRFVFHDQPSTLDSGAYMGMTKDDQAEVQATYTDLFRIETKVKPNKKDILKALRDGIDVAGFSIDDNHPAIFKFKAQK